MNYIVFQKSSPEVYYTFTSCDTMENDASQTSEVSKYQLIRQRGNVSIIRQFSNLFLTVMWLGFFHINAS